MPLSKRRQSLSLIPQDQWSTDRCIHTSVGPIWSRYFGSFCGPLIPAQDPTLFSGTVKFNLDPENQRTEDECENAIRICKLEKTIDQCGGLFGEIKRGGSNFSGKIFLKKKNHRLKPLKNEFKMSISNIFQLENVSYFVLPVPYFVKRQFYYLMKPLPQSMVIRIQTFNQYCEMNFHRRHFLRLPIG